MTGSSEYLTGTTHGGEQESVGVTLSAALAGGMGGVTGVPMALALSMFERGTNERRGAFAPEMVVDPDSFFDELAPLCTPTRADANELLVITLTTLDEDRYSSSHRNESWRESEMSQIDYASTSIRVRDDITGGPPAGVAANRQPRDLVGPARSAWPLRRRSATL